MNVSPDEQEASPNKAFPLMIIPFRQAKFVHFIRCVVLSSFSISWLKGKDSSRFTWSCRHGQGYHNVAGHANHENYKSEDWFDAHLTPEGWRQAEKLNNHIIDTGLKVYVSERVFFVCCKTLELFRWIWL
jgi:hypothetical protein